ncbi:uncharacterized protein LOC124155760 [Ischnura elegans]|uniref:uncharacterized protein LOC124155760 n=1 Tax=Ischnura elegans TaxID=197161 RepID=UPI001ED8709D|nr:uncharacterized protein LOC124155760 [Ischnura elegans]XP_046385803.1 uncharacterized protein LOC124155760 [Ischnura elegans]
MFRKAPKAAIGAALLLLVLASAHGLSLENPASSSGSRVRRSRREEESSMLHSQEQANLYEVRKIPWDDTVVISDTGGKSSGLRKNLRKESENDRQTTLPEHWRARKIEMGKFAREELVEYVKPASLTLPDTSGISGQLTEELGVQRFFSMWMVFNDVDVNPTVQGEAFVILAPVDKQALLGPVVPPLEQLLTRPQILRNLLLSHVVMGKSALSLIKLATLPHGARNGSHAASTEKLEGNFTTLSGRVLHLQWADGTLHANNQVLVQFPGIALPKGGFILLLDKYLFLDEVNSQLKALSSKSSPLISLPEGRKEEEALERYAIAEELVDERKPYISPEAFMFFLNNSLSKIPFAETFRHLLSKANVTKYLCPGESYTVVVPPNEAFRSWDPIDYGFRPFAVADFISVVIRNHFVRGAVNVSSLRDGDRLQTLDGGSLSFRHPSGKSPSLNGVDMFTTSNADITIPGGKIILLRGSKVLFVDEDVVRQLRRLYPEAESGPPILVDWTGSTFLAYVSIHLNEHSQFVEEESFDQVLSEIGESRSGSDSPATNADPTDDKIETEGVNGTTQENKTDFTDISVISACSPNMNDLNCQPEPSTESESDEPLVVKYCDMNEVPENTTEDTQSNSREGWSGGMPGRDWNALFNMKSNNSRKQIPVNNKTRKESFNHMLRIIHQAGGHIESKESDGYTIFIPTDKGLEGANFPEEGPLRDSWALSILYNHMVVGRVFDKELKVGANFTTLGNKTITVCSSEDAMWLNGAKIIESNLIIYDLGVMIIVDKPVFPLPVLDENSKWAYDVCV